MDQFGYYDDTDLNSFNIEDLKRKVKENKERITVLEQKITSLQDEIVSLRSEFTDQINYVWRELYDIKK